MEALEISNVKNVKKNLVQMENYQHMKAAHFEKYAKIVQNEFKAAYKTTDHETYQTSNNEQLLKEHNYFKDENIDNIHTQDEIFHVDKSSVKIFESMDKSENLNDSSVKQEIECDPLQNDSQVIDFVEGEKNFKCDICNKEFFQFCELKTHLYIHDGNIEMKDEKCEICNNNFIGLFENT